MPRVKRREREIERIRQDILEAAARVFSREGFSGATMQEIAREAGYTAPSLYTYFEGKDSLLGELFQRFLAEVLELYERPTPRGVSFAQALEMLMTSAMGLCDRRRDELIAFANVANSGPIPINLCAGDPEGTAGTKLIIERLASWIEEKAGPDDLGDLDSIEAAYLIFGAVYARLMRWNHQGRTEALVDTVPRTLDFCLSGARGIVAED